MKTILTLLVVSTIFSSCKKVDKSEFNTPCTDSCTIVQGRFITVNNQGVANVPLEIQSEIRPTLGLGLTTIRKIASGRTDNNGFYSLKFSLQPREYGQMQAATVFLKFTYDKTRFVPITWYENFGSKESLTPLRRKDTTLNANIYLSTKSKLRVRLQNYTPIQGEDYFSIVTHCAAGLEKLRSSEGSLKSTQTVTEKEIDACGDEQTMIFLAKRKNGVTTYFIDTVLIATGQTLAVTYTYQKKLRTVWPLPRKIQNDADDITDIDLPENGLPF